MMCGASPHDDTTGTGEGTRRSKLLKVMNAHDLSSDGIGAGEDQSLQSPFGHAVDPAPLMSWAGATASWPSARTAEAAGASTTATSRGTSHNIGAEIMGRNKFGPQRGPWQDHEWQGWWGDEPPFTRRCSSDPPPASVVHALRHHVPLRRRRPGDGPRAGAGSGAGQGRPARRRSAPSGSSSTRRPRRHDARGGRAGEARVRAAALGIPDGHLLDRFHLEVVPSPSGVTHHLFWRK